MTFFLLTTVGFFCACHPGPTTPSTVKTWATSLSPLPAVPPDGSDFSLHEEVTLTWVQDGSTHQQSFQSITEKSGSTLVMVLLGPHGGVGVSIKQRDKVVEMESHIDLPIQPEMLLWDLHKRFFLHDSTSGTAPPSNGLHKRVERGLQITETFAQRQLQTREIKDGSWITQITYQPNGILLKAFHIEHSRMTQAYTVQTRNLNSTNESMPSDLF